MGAARVPQRCIPPGCPAAVDVLALIMMPWVKQARQMHADSKARGWVDDLAWWGRGPPDTLVQAVVEVEGLVATLRDSYDLVANHIKSCVIGNSPHLVEQLQQRLVSNFQLFLIKIFSKLLLINKTILIFLCYINRKK